METRIDIIIAISALSTLIGCVSLPGIIDAYFIDGDLISLLKDDISIPFWFFVLLTFTLLALLAIVIGQGLTGWNPKLDEKSIKEYMERIIAILANGSSYTGCRIRQELGLNKFNEQQYENFQLAIGRLVEEGLISVGNAKGTYRLSKQFSHTPPSSQTIGIEEIL